MMVKTSSPAALVVSTQDSANDLKPAHLAPISHPNVRRAREIYWL
jgi:hypothetical protein